jgi:hypothetical protein
MKNSSLSYGGFLTFAMFSASIAQVHAEDLKVAALNINKVEVAAKRTSDTRPVTDFVTRAASFAYPSRSLHAARKTSCL